MTINLSQHKIHIYNNINSIIENKLTDISKCTYDMSDNQFIIVGGILSKSLAIHEMHGQHNAH